MTDRAIAFIVTLEDDQRIGDFVLDDDQLRHPLGADRIAMAIAMIKGVSQVELVVSEWRDKIAEARARDKIYNELRDLLSPR
jgi:hypothetical protein